MFGQRHRRPVAGTPSNAAGGIRAEDGDGPLPDRPEAHVRAALRARALRYLSRREHSRAELRRKLLATERAESAPAIVDQVLDALEAARWLSDQRFAEGFVRTRAERLGGTRLARELAARGIDRDTAADVVAPLKDDEIERADALWRRRFGTLPEDRKERGRQARFLVQRGFSEATVRRVFDRARAMPIDTDDGADCRPPLKAADGA